MFAEWEAEPPVPQDAEPETEPASEPAPVPPPEPESEPEPVTDGGPPAHSALKDEWIVYAESLGHDVEGLTKEEIIQLVEGE
jgi:hypothetical protein